MSSVSLTRWRSVSFAFIPTLASLFPLIDASAQQAPAGPASSLALPEIVVEQLRATGIQDLPASGQPTPTRVTARPTAQVQTRIDADRTADTRAFSVTDLLLDSPGVSTKQGNGPRDVGISIRGSNARQGYAIRNIVIFDDGFPVTQPDGLSRSDLIDPHAYGSVDVVRGPSSALYGNYATGGAINFHTRPGHAIDGLEIGADGGSYGYLNTYLAYGDKVGAAETSVFASQIRGAAATSHSDFSIQTANAFVTYAPTPEDRVSLKVIENHTFANLSNRLSLDQFTINPYQRGCAIAASASAGCQNQNLRIDGATSATIPVSADEAGFRRDDNRAILGVRYEHDFGSVATWRTQVTLDDRNINQPTGTTSAIGDYPSINAFSDIVGHGQMFGLEATHYGALFVNAIRSTGYTLNVMPGGNATLGALTQVVSSEQTNFGGRLREEVKPATWLTFVAGVGVERSILQGLSTAYSYAAPNVISATNLTAARRGFLNTAPEIAVAIQPLKDWRVTGRVATGYGAPQVSNLFVTAAGVPGNNTDLKPQSNLGYDLLVEYQPARSLNLSVDGFYEFFRNELVTQSPGPGLLSYTFNAPRSEHRGVEAAARWAFLNGWLLTASYTFDDQIYTSYVEQLSAGSQTALFDRAGNHIPGVPRQELLLRLGYDVPDGALKGWGAYAEYVRQDGFFIDNANLLQVPGYGLLNFNLHYTRDVVAGPVRSFTAYVEARNVTNRTYVASANNISNSIDPVSGAVNGAAVLRATPGSIYAGQPLSVYGGFRVKF